MQRLFIPVGQGAFYCEKFSEEDFCGKVNVVYDCGSTSGLSVLKAEIARSFSALIPIISCMRIRTASAERPRMTP